MNHRCLRLFALLLPAAGAMMFGCSRVGLSEEPGSGGQSGQDAGTGADASNDVNLPDPDAACREGDETFDGCNTCRCQDGEFVCTRLFCPDAGPDGGDLPDTSVDQCIQDCGIGCPPPEFQVCATDGNLYCSECEIGCRQLQVAQDSSLCAQCEVPPNWEPVPFEQVQIPADCQAIADFSFSIDSSEFLDSVFECERRPLSQRLEFDPSEEALFYVRIFGDPVPVRVEVYREGDTFWVYWVENVWCQGVQPPPSFFLVRVPGADSGAILSQSCSTGICAGPPPP